MSAAAVLRTAMLYGLAIASGAFVLRWLEYRHAARLVSTEIYIAFVALAFSGLGAWLGHRLTRRPAPGGFEPNAQALEYLAITDREYEVLALLAAGHSNDGIAKSLFVSVNTVKTHLSRLYDKLGVSRRTQAIARARTLRLVP